MTGPPAPPQEFRCIGSVHPRRVILRKTGFWGRGSEKRGQVRGRGLPGPKIRTWGTRLYWSDVGHLPAHRKERDERGTVPVTGMTGAPARSRNTNSPCTNFTSAYHAGQASSISLLRRDFLGETPCCFFHNRRK